MSKPIEKMTKQEIFDRVCRHLAKQKRASMKNDGTCLYRGPDGTKCAAGALIPDEEYRAVFEGCRAHAISFFDETPSPVAYFVDDLQSVHDSARGLTGEDTRSWRDQLADLAAQHNLDPSVLATFPADLPYAPDDMPA